MELCVWGLMGYSIFYQYLQGHGYLWWGSVANLKVSGSHFQGLRRQSSMSYGRKCQFPGSQFQGPRVSSPWVSVSQGPRSQCARSRVSGPDFRLPYVNVQVGESSLQAFFHLFIDHLTCIKYQQDFPKKLISYKLWKFLKQSL